MRRSLLPLTLFSLIVACRPTATPEPEAETAPTEALEEGAGTEAEAEAASVSGHYALHEWGLVRVFPNTAEVATSGIGTARLAALREADDGAPSPFDELQGVGNDDSHELDQHLAPAAGGKPVIYLHPLEGFDPATEITVTVSIADGTLHEVWPLSGAHLVDQRAHRFGPVEIQVGSACDASAAPTLESDFCRTLTAGGGVCEAAELRDYLSGVDHCLRTPAGEAPVLLYNGWLTVRRPLNASPGEPYTVTNTTEHVVGPAWLAVGDDDRRFVRIDPVAPGDTAFVEAEPFGHDALIGELRASLVAQGLFETEADAFIAAWRPDVLAPTASWQMLGFYAPETVDTLLPLTLEPPATERVRVLAFTLETGL